MKTQSVDEKVKSLKITKYLELQNTELLGPLYLRKLDLPLETFCENA